MCLVGYMLTSYYYSTTVWFDLSTACNTVSPVETCNQCDIERRAVDPLSIIRLLYAQQCVWDSLESLQQSH
jgi:hypothetical protein